jgi:hypothetical protein
MYDGRSPERRLHIMQAQNADAASLPHGSCQHILR